MTPLLAVALWAGAVSLTQATETVWDALRAPGSVVVLRHSYAPGSFDPPDARLEDCTTQRNLDASGRAQARRTGEAFQRNSVVVGAVLSSPRCRCLDTARLDGRLEPATLNASSIIVSPLAFTARIGLGALATVSARGPRGWQRGRLTPRSVMR